MIFDDDLPLWSEEQQCWVMRESPEWIVSVVPMIYNDRITIARPETFHHGYVAGFCFDKSPGAWKAMLAATAWQIGVRRYPDGLKKVACDSRDEDPDVTFIPDPFQTLCWLCLNVRPSEAALLNDPRMCAGCGTTKNEGRSSVPFDPSMQYAQGGYRLNLKESACL